MTKKKGYEPWENKSRKSDIGIEGCKAQGRIGMYSTRARKVREHVEHIAYEARSTWGTRAEHK